MREELKRFVEENNEVKIGVFCDMDGVIANFDTDLDNKIQQNFPKYFQAKKPMRSIIKILEEISKYPNVTMHILSACLFRNQAEDKIIWLNMYAPFFKRENAHFLIKEVSKYNYDNKAEKKVDFIENAIRENNYDFVVYIEDEYLMLKTAYKRLGNKVKSIHISNFIE